MTASYLADPQRRRLLQTAAAGGLLGSLGLASRSAQAATQRAAHHELRGTEFHLHVREQQINFTGKPRTAITLNNQLPAPTLRWREGTTVTIKVTNHLNRPTALHWHGILLPWQMDGVPGISFDGIAPGDTFTYQFEVKQHGTYWYHAHAGFQEQQGLYGAIIIDPATPEASVAERDCVVMLSDWTDMDPQRIFNLLRKHSDYFNYHQPTLPGFIDKVSQQGLGAALQARAMWNRMRMNPHDLVDVGGFAYHHLMNGATEQQNWTGLFQPGERIRLRLINAAANSFYDWRIPDLPSTVIAADGQAVKPVTVDELRIAPGETYDLIVKPQNRAYTLFAQSIDRAGFARGTLTPRAGLTAPVPAMDPVPTLSMVDMMGKAHHGMTNHGMQQMSGMHGKHGMHSTHQMPKPSPVRHAKSEYHNPAVAMRVNHPRHNLDDPGVGLRHNGRRVLTYADLHTTGAPISQGEVSRHIELHLTGNMSRYLWSFDGLPYAKAKPVHFPAGELLRITLSNDTMMTHPIHLHGMWSEIESPDGAFQVRKHTIMVQPAQRISFRVNANAPGRWAWHCHLLYHMAAGMFREVVVA